MNYHRITLESTRVCLTLAFTLLAFVLPPAPAHGQAVIATVPLFPVADTQVESFGIGAVAVKPVTHKIDVPSASREALGGRGFSGRGVTVIDGATHAAATVDTGKLDPRPLRGTARRGALRGSECPWTLRSGSDALRLIALTSSGDGRHCWISKTGS